MEIKADEIITIITLFLTGLRVLASSSIGKSIYLDRVWSIIMKIISALPLLENVVQSLYKLFDNLAFEKGKKVIDEYAFKVFAYVEQVSKRLEMKGEDKMNMFLREIEKLPFVRELPEPVKSQLIGYARKVAEEIVFHQKNNNLPYAVEPKPKDIFDRIGSFFLNSAYFVVDKILSILGLK